MEKQIMTSKELVEEYRRTGIAPEMSSEYMETRLQENCVEIAMNNLRDMMNIADIGRDTLLRDFISVWAREAEMEFIANYHENAGNYSYYDFIDDFSEKKLEEFRKAYDKNYEPSKIAKLVTFEYTTRVIVNKNEMPEVEEEDAINSAIEKVKHTILNDLCFDHCTEVVNDEECPYDPETDEQ